MAAVNPTNKPFKTVVLSDGDGTGNNSLPASYRYYEINGNQRSRVIADPSNNVKSFLKTELSLGYLNEILKRLWFAGSRRGATQLHFHVALGREIVVVDRMDLHLLWDNGRVFLKPVPKFLLDPSFWVLNLKCPNNNTCQHPAEDQLANPAQLAGDPGLLGANQESLPCMQDARKAALGFLYTYACLISSESDFFLANEKRLLPRNKDEKTIDWENWKKLSRELVQDYDPEKIHPRFLRAELRLSRINTISYFTRLRSFDTHLCGWDNYSSLFRDNLAWMAAATVFVALVLTAMQVGLATDKLKENIGFQRASYGFTIFAILGPMGVFGLVAFGALFNLIRDLPWLFRSNTNPPQPVPQGNPQPNQNGPANQDVGQIA
ncbi:hypothetical protein MMC25_006156 [Agyrium rufum]|nr:hypothetical protein [Agyrium rufum]